MVWCLLLVSTLLLASVGSMLECPMSGVQIISQNTTLLSPLNITAITYYSRFPARFFGNFTPAVWCIPSAVDSNPRISLRFSQLVLITGFIPGGYVSNNEGSDREYVTNFYLQYSAALDDSTFSDPQEFNISADNLDQLVVLEEPFLARRLRFQVNDFISVTVARDICWSMAMYGCHHSEATQIQQPSACPSLVPPLCSASTVTSTVVVETCVGVESTPALQLPQLEVVRDYQALAIVLPIAMVTILIVAAVVGVGVVLCVRGKNKKGSSVQYSLQQLETIKVLENNALYEATEVEHGRERSETIREVENILYAEDLRTDDHEGREYEGLSDHDQQQEESTAYSVPFQHQGGPMQVTANVSYAATPPILHSDSRTGVNNVYEVPNSS